MSENAGLDLITFDPETGIFHDSENSPVDRRAIDQIGGVLRESESSRPVGERSLAGGRTLARQAVLKSLVRGESEAQRGTDGRPSELLQKLLRVASLHAAAVEGIAYSQGESRNTGIGTGTSVANLRAAIKAVTGVDGFNKLGRIVAATAADNYTDQGVLKVKHTFVAPSLTPDSYTPTPPKPAPSLAWSGFSF